MGYARVSRRCPEGQRQGTFSESSGGGRVVWSSGSFLTLRHCLLTWAWGEGRLRYGLKYPPSTGTLGDRSLPCNPLLTWAWGEGRLRYGLKYPPPAGTLGDRSLPETQRGRTFVRPRWKRNQSQSITISCGGDAAEQEHQSHPATKCWFLGLGPAIPV